MEVPLWKRPWTEAEGGMVLIIGVVEKYDLWSKLLW